MRLHALHWRTAIGVMAIVAGIAAGTVGFMAFAQAPQQEQAPRGEEERAASLIGLRVFSAEGLEVGLVSAVTVGADGLISEIKFTTSSPLGLGERTVTIQKDSFTALDGAVVLDLSAEEIDALPVQTVRRGTSV